MQPHAPHLHSRARAAAAASPPPAGRMRQRWLSSLCSNAGLAVARNLHGRAPYLAWVSASKAPPLPMGLRHSKGEHAPCNHRYNMHGYGVQKAGGRRRGRV